MGGIDIFYVYRFLDKNKTPVYIGKTNGLSTRMAQHFKYGYLTKEECEEVNTVEYIEFENESNQFIYELYLINKHKPRFNKQSKKPDELTLSISSSDLVWKNYKGFVKKETIVSSGVVEEKVNPTQILDESHITLMLQNEVGEYEIYNGNNLLHRIKKNSKQAFTQAKEYCLELDMPLVIRPA